MYKTLIGTLLFLTTTTIYANQQTLTYDPVCLRELENDEELNIAKSVQVSDRDLTMRFYYINYTIKYHKILLQDPLIQAIKEAREHKILPIPSRAPIYGGGNISFITVPINWNSRGQATECKDFVI